MSTQYKQKTKVVAFPIVNETARLNALYRYNILDTGSEVAFDRVTTLAAHFFNVPFAQLTFIDEDRVWVKSCYGGMHIQQVKRSRSLSSHLLSLKHPVQIPETLLNLQFANTESVMTGIVGIRFFASAPITTPEGYNIGVLSIFDLVPQQLPDEKLSILSELASVVMDELELRITTVKSREEDQELKTKNSIPQSSYKQNLIRFNVETKKVKSDSTVPPRCQNVEQLLQQYHEKGERDFSGIDLSGKDLGGETLENANLSEAYLNGANFRGTKLRSVNLSGANLRGATFNGADLRKANLSFADVRGTDFSGADLRGANLTFVLLNEANITGALLCGAIVPDGSIRE
jgi:sigma-B regulation protein RsbU (phosphoserine phosphatase)